MPQKMQKLRRTGFKTGFICDTRNPVRSTLAYGNDKKNEFGKTAATRVSSTVGFFFNAEPRMTRGSLRSETMEVSNRYAICVLLVEFLCASASLR